MTKPSATPLAQALRTPKAPAEKVAPTTCPTCGTCGWGDDVIGAARAYLASVAVKGMERNGQTRAQVCLKILEGPQNLSDEALEAEMHRRMKSKPA